MIVDLFLYAGETSMAQLRQIELADGVVHRHIAVVADRTHQGELVEIDDCPQFGDTPVDTYRVRTLPIPDGGRGGLHSPHYQWIERQHRQAMRDAARELVDIDEAMLLLSDVDEIPSPAGVAALIDTLIEGPLPWAVLGQRMHGFALNYLHPQLWWGTMASLARHVDPQDMRDRRGQYDRVAHVSMTPDAGDLGWHLSWMGSRAEQRRKLETFSHAELGDLDVEACWRDGVHANGEELTRLPWSELRYLTWPTAIDRPETGFIVPADWWAPRWMSGWG